MKKAMAVFFLVFACLAGMLPWVNGMVMERLVNTALVQMNQNASGVRFDLASYHRGYARTIAEWTMDLGNLAPLAGVREIRFTERASHGWAGITSDIRLDKNDWYARWVAASQNFVSQEPLSQEHESKDPLTIRTRYTAFGPIVTTISLDAVTVMPEKRPMTVGAMTLVVTADLALAHVTAMGNWEGMSGEGRGRLGPVSFESDMTRVSGTVWSGRTVTRAESYVSEDSDLAVSNLVLTTETLADKDAGKMEIAAAFAAEDVVVNGASQSESPSPWELGIRVKLMDIRAYEDLRRYYGELAARLAPALVNASISPQQKVNFLKAAVWENPFRTAAQMEKLLKKGFGLEISPLDITRPRGRVQGDLSLSLLKDMTLAGFLPVALRPDLALEIFSLESRMELDEKFSTAAPYLTTPLFHGMKTGIFVLEGGRLVHQARTRDGKLYLNGQAVDLGGE